MSDNSSDRRSALIAALIAVPAAVLISMLVHHFLPVPSEPMISFSSQTIVSEPVQKMPPSGKQFQKPQRPQAMQPQVNDLTPLYKQKANIAEKIWKEMDNQFKQGSIGIIDILPFQVEYFLAEGDLFRYQNKIRRFGNSVSDLAVKYEAAKKIAEYQKLVFEKGSISSTDLMTNEMNAVNAELQLKSNRTFLNPQWNEKYKEYKKNPGLNTYLAMLEAERAAQPARRF